VARDITEGRATRAIAVDLGIVTGTSLWQNNDIAYDMAIGGIPFVLATNDSRTYLRQTAPFKKDQFDNGQEPGEQSLTGWWLRSQQSFHSGTGINFYDPATTDTMGHYRFADSKGVNVWEQGQVTLLKDVTEGHVVTTPIQSNGRSLQQARSIKWGSTSGVLLHDGYDVDKIPVDNPTVPVHFIDYNSGTDFPVYGICDDGTNAYWVTNNTAGGGKLTVYKKVLTADSTVANTSMFASPSIVVTNAVMEYVKDRIIMCANNAVYEFSSSASALPTPLYTHPSTSYVYTSIAASGAAIYTAGYNGVQSTIHKYTLTSTGTMPTLTSAIVAAELPAGEVVHKLYYYLGYMLIGTSKGVRVATVSDADGSINYGPLVVKTTQPCYDFAARDKYIWCATGAGTEAGVIRIDLGTELEPLRFAYANDLYVSGETTHVTTSCAFANGTERLVFTTANDGSTNGHVYVESDSILTPSGYVTTGHIRFGTLEPKNYKRLLGRGDFTYGSVTMYTVDSNGDLYDHITYDSSIGSTEVSTNQPQGSHEYLSYKFSLNRDGTDSTKGPVFMGYQAKATIATPRQRQIRFYVYCMDTETDRYNAQFGYTGRAFEKMLSLEDMEESGDIVMLQDLNTGENRQVQIEQVTLVNNTPPDKGLSNFGGVVEIVVRTV
jgi:hypothetical protein